MKITKDLYQGSLALLTDYYQLTMAYGYWKSGAAEKEGVFKASESIILKNLLSLDQVLAKEIMTPRTVVKIANSESSIKEFYSENKLDVNLGVRIGHLISSLTGF